MALRSRVLAVVAIALPLVLAAGCSGSTAPGAASAAQTGPGGGIPGGPAPGPQALSETGSTLLFPVLRNWAAAYRQQHANVSITTAGTGSGKGIAESSAGRVDIGASDAYLSSGDLVTNPAMVNIPLAVSAPPDPGALTARLAGAGELKAAGRWTRLASELDLIEKQAADVASQCREVERRAAALLDRREELRGLLDAYQARAARLGGAEDTDLDARYARARELLWTAPCDLPAATAAVTGYQQAVLALSGRERRP